MIQDPVSILAFLAGVVGLVFQLARLPSLRPLFDRLPPLVWSYFLPMLSTTARLLPDQSPLYRALALAALGNVLGTGLGLLVAQVLSGMAP